MGGSLSLTLLMYNIYTFSLTFLCACVCVRSLYDAVAIVTTRLAQPAAVAGGGGGVKRRPPSVTPKKDTHTGGGRMFFFDTRTLCEKRISLLVFVCYFTKTAVAQDAWCQQKQNEMP